MKKLTALTLGCLLTATLAFAGQPSESDQKWLEVVEKKIVEGQTQVSTPNEERVELVKDWAAKNGYSVQVMKSESGYRLEFSRNLAQN